MYKAINFWHYFQNKNKALNKVYITQCDVFVYSIILMIVRYVNCSRLIKFLGGLVITQIMIYKHTLVNF